jgi:hypothetical protein
MKNSILIFTLLFIFPAGQGAVKTWTGGVDDPLNRHPYVQPFNGISLVDLLEGTTTDPGIDPDYSFSHHPANDPNRFLLRFSAKSIGAPGPGTGEQISVYASAEQLLKKFTLTEKQPYQGTFV